ncbi:HAMP domain-containing histidine kinase [Halobacillus salinarum]|uniref:histidine kinase n=1 Tax=Halobacillus salinarum TaxID=2932257 RepID=A0ABY4ELG1_9BACI|nr:HAMP domain-containing sensor histidine kinase [Halobacillus salinarum]UOQ45240.1 HAMP domain-containing histidine kinase [Halobacillus salinarum]
MKLLYQLNTAFTVLLVIVMSITAFFTYSLLMDVLIQDEQRQLEARAKFMTDIINEQDPSVRIPQLSQLIQDRDFPLLLFDQRTGKILFRTLPKETSEEWIADFDDLIKDEVWEGNGKKYVAYAFSSGRDGSILVMATPLDDLEIVQSGLTYRMLAVFLIGLVLAVVVSHFLTRRLVTPLSRLKQEMKKIEQRQFTEVKPVHSTGEIKEVEQSVRQMASELERYITSQKQFFQNASHELKTPLMSIQGYAEGIRDGIFEGEAANKGLNVMVSETERLKKIVNEMILLAKLDSSEDVYHPERTEVVHLVSQAKDRLVPLARDKEVELRFLTEGTFYSYVDSERVLQALINMIGNAIRHAHQIVTIESLLQDKQITIRISDDGEGIPEDLLPHLFERFIKGKEGETGLGLAISRAIVVRSGGTIKASNKEEETGAVFELTLPAME